jgi:putative proteasome-type protease
MTYCVAMRLRQGMVFASDTRTNAGIDHISVFSKMHRFARPNERQIVLLNSGNLATTQQVVNRLRQDVVQNNEPHLYSVRSMFEAAELVGRKLREVIEVSRQSGSQADFNGNFLIGGQVKGEESRLFMVYPEGNFIEATRETPFFQIGESKYGKPIFDRVLHFDMPLEEALRCALISFDSTMRSNLSVGLPVDVLRLDAGFALQEPKMHRIHEEDPYWLEVRRQWGEGLRSVFAGLPEIPWWSENETK